MARVRVRLDSSGVAEVLEAAGMTAETRRAAEAVAAQVRAQRHVASSAGQEGGPELPVDVRVEPAMPGRGIRDRRRVGIVTITHPAGMGMQAKYGVLTRAAGAVGLEVTEAPQ